MFLNTLKSEEKKRFFDLAYLVATSDGEYSSEEKMLMNSYADEMSIAWNENAPSESVEAIIDILEKECSIKEKKIIVFEIIGLAMSDGHYDAEEKKIVCSMCKTFGLQESYADECERCIKEYLHLQMRMNRLVEE